MSLWPWRWLRLRLLKRQSLSPTVLFRTTLIWMIKLDEVLILLGSLTICYDTKHYWLITSDSDFIRWYLSCLFHALNPPRRGRGKSQAIAETCARIVAITEPQARETTMRNIEGYWEEQDFPWRLSWTFSWLLRPVLGSEIVFTYVPWFRHIPGQCYDDWP